jgi:hypothetical protein
MFNDKLYVAIVVIFIRIFPKNIYVEHLSQNNLTCSTGQCFFMLIYIWVFSHFGRRKVLFGLGTKSIEVNSLYFTIFSIDRGIFFG